MDIPKIIEALPVGVVLGVVGIAAVFMLLVPLTLKLAGLTGQQIIDVLTMTTKFLIEIISEFRSENKSSQ